MAFNLGNFGQELSRQTRSAADFFRPQIQGQQQMQNDLVLALMKNRLKQQDPFTQLVNETKLLNFINAANTFDPRLGEELSRSLKGRLSGTKGTTIQPTIQSQQPSVGRQVSEQSFGSFVPLREEAARQRGDLFATDFKISPSGFRFPKELKSESGITREKVAEKRAQLKFKEEERKQQAEQALSGTQMMIRGYKGSLDELKEFGFDKIGQADVEGLTQRFSAFLVEKTGQLPTTTRYLNRVKVIANQSARDVEGGRVTDQDRQIYADAMANAINFPTDTNVGLSADKLMDLRNKGGNIEPVLKDFRNSGIDIFVRIAKEVDRLSKPVSSQQNILPSIGETFRGQKVINVQKVSD